MNPSLFSARTFHAESPMHIFSSHPKPQTLVRVAVVVVTIDTKARVRTSWQVYGNPIKRYPTLGSAPYRGVGLRQLAEPPLNVV